MNYLGKVVFSIGTVLGVIMSALTAWNLYVDYIGSKAGNGIYTLDEFCIEMNRADACKAAMANDETELILLIVVTIICIIGLIVCRKEAVSE